MLTLFKNTGSPFRPIVCADCGAAMSKPALLFELILRSKIVATPPIGELGVDGRY